MIIGIRNNTKQNNYAALFCCGHISLKRDDEDRKDYDLLQHNEDPNEDPSHRMFSNMTFCYEVMASTGGHLGLCQYGGHNKSRL